MITKLTITDPTNTVCPWWPKVKAFEGRTEFEFKPGINILWGKNGSGKSSVVQMLARLTHSGQGGVTKVTTETLRHFYDHQGFHGGQDLETDGQGVWYCDPSERVGLIGGSFDYDFMDMGLQNTMFKGSHGETTLMRVYNILVDMKARKRPEIEYKHLRKPPVEGSKDRYADQDREEYKRWLDATKYLRGEDKTSPPTILFDEPDRSLDIPTQLRFWDTLTAHDKNYQIIVASHSLFAMDIPGANYIELVPGYLNQCRAARAMMMRYAKMAETLAQAPVATPVPEAVATPKKKRVRTPKATT